MYVCVCMCACVHVCVYVCMCVCMCVCVCEGVDCQSCIKMRAQSLKLFVARKHIMVGGASCLPYWLAKTTTCDWNNHSYILGVFFYRFQLNMEGIKYKLQLSSVYRQRYMKSCPRLSLGSSLLHREF